MKILLFLALSLAIHSANFSDKIDYQHRTLLKALDKKNDNSELTEIHLTEEIEWIGEGKYFRTAGDEIAYVYVGRVNSCRSGGCSAPGVEINTSFEYFDYFILYNAQGTVEQVKVFNYQATHGQEITLKAWLHQFQHYSANNDLIVGKQIDGIAGATISVYAITEDIRQKTMLLKEIIEVLCSEK